uniref:Rhamnogalacturonan endolyase n=1 Tax=Phytophthora ramorum TaxID=164328 RepID=H3H6I5_PHYRM
MLSSLLTAVLAAASVFTAAPSTVSAATAFGYTTGSDQYIISTGKGLTVTMKQSTCDITSIKYNDKELQYKSKATHVNSGLGKVTSSIKTLSDSKKTIRVICKATGLEQTYLFRPNENVIYLGTHHSSDLVLPELRFLARLDKTVVNSGITEATIESGMTAIEAEDVVTNSKGLTRSKFYSAVPFIDDAVHGVKSSAAGVYFVMSEHGYETSSGGPFFRDINNKFDVSNELTFYMNSEHTRTEDYRYGFHGPYALSFTSGAAPLASSLDFSFFQDLGLTGFIPSTKRGKMAGSITDSKNVLGGSDVVVGFSNAAAQYWVKVAAGTKTFTSPLMKAGRYTATVYKKQLAVGTASVLINAGTTKTQGIAVSYNETSKPIWRIGEWDGTPDGFLNADKIHKMHPSDSRMSEWKALTFKAGLDADSAFPMAQFRGMNDPITVSFSLTAAQAKTSRTLKIGLTLAQSSGRSSVTVNGKWTAAVPASVAVKTRGITRGVTVGNYKLYEYTIPASALVAGTNTIKLTVASGASDPAEKFLAASVVFDALELV